MFPRELPGAIAVSVVSTPTPDLEPYLSERHEEILGLTPEQSLKLAEAIQGVPRQISERREPSAGDKLSCAQLTFVAPGCEPTCG